MRGVCSLGRQRRHGRNVENGTVSAARKLVRGRVADDENGSCHDIDAAELSIERSTNEVLAQTKPGVVNYQANGAVPVGRSCANGLCAVLGGEVCGQDLNLLAGEVTDPLRERFQGINSASNEDNVISFGGELPCDLFADARCCACDECGSHA